MTDNGGFKLNGIAVSTYGATLMYAPGQPMLPGTRDRTADVLNRAGQYWIDSELGVRELSLPCQFYDCDSAAELDTKIRALARAFVDNTGRPKQIRLELDDSPGWYYTVRYNGAIPFDRAWVGAIDFTLELIADDPYGHRVLETEDIELVTTDPQSWTVTNAGTVATPAKICITNNGATAVSGIKISLEYEVD